MNPGPDYLRDYHLLGCDPGDDRATLERAWRRAVSALHPDRGGGDLEARSERLHEVTAAYRRLSKFAELHGRLPGEAPVDGPASAPRPVVVAAPPAKSTSRRAWWWLVPVAALFAWGAATQQPAPDDRSAAPRPAAAPSTLGRQDATSRAAATIQLGDRQEHVLAVAGAPLEVLGNEWDVHWHYGPSFIHLRGRRVVDWYSSPLRPLPVESERPVPAH